MNPKIPKRIIQTGKQIQQPLRNRALMSNVKLLNPDYEYLFFDDERVETFIDQEFPQYRSLFDSFRFRIQRYDFFRYLAVYHYGGFYFDLDVLLASNLSGLLDFGCVFPFEGLTLSRLLRSQYQMDWEIGNYAFGASPGHPFLQAIIANCVKAQEDSSWVEPMMRGVPLLSKNEFYVLATTGPGLISRTLAENSELARTVKVLFPEDVCDARSWNLFGDLGVHLMEASWRPQKSFLHKRLAQHWENWKHRRVLRQSRKLGKKRRHFLEDDSREGRLQDASGGAHKPLVSILIPAFNAEEWITATLRSAISQTWPRKEIIVVDDGSTDATLEIARTFESDGVHVVTQENQGAAAARNKAYSLSQGAYIQWLDADDLLAPDKIAKQMEVLEQFHGKKVMLSSPWGLFMYRHSRAKFAPTALWGDLSPTEWLLLKMGKNIYMQTATWLVSRELSEAASPWDIRLLGDDDGEYFCRVLLASDGVHFVPEARVYYRGPGLAFGSLSYIVRSPRKLAAHWLSMKLHIGYLRSLEDSERVRDACLKYLQTSLGLFYPENQAVVDEMEQMAASMGGHLGPPTLSWKYSWMQGIFGWRLAKIGQESLLRVRWSVERFWDKTLFQIEKRKMSIKSKI